MFSTYIINGKAVGPLAPVLNAARLGQSFVPELLQPWLDDDDRPCVTLPLYGKHKLNKEGEPVYNEAGEPVWQRQDILCAELEKMGRASLRQLSPLWNTSFMRKNEWFRVQSRVIQATRQRIRAWNDLAAANPITGFDGMGTYAFEYEMENDPGEAIRHMEIIGDLRHDETQYKIGSIPLPVTQSGFHYTQRRMANAAMNGRSVANRTADKAGRRIAESMERVTIGTSTGVTWGTRSTGVQPHEGTSTEYGYTNAPWRFAKTDLHTPSASSPEQILEDLIEMRETLIANGFYGPFNVYYSTGYDRFFSDDYFRTGGTSVNRIVRERLAAIEDIGAIRRLDFLTSGYQLIMTDMSNDTAEAVIGMDVTVVQWPEMGGALQKFRAMMIAAPLIHRNYDGETGIVHGTTS